MSAQETIQIRVDAKTKAEARATLEELGLDMSSAVKLFLRNVINTQSIPLNLVTANGYTVAQEQEMLAAYKDARENGKKYTNLEELFADLEI